MKEYSITPVREIKKKDKIKGGSFVLKNHQGNTVFTMVAALKTAHESKLYQVLESDNGDRFIVFKEVTVLEEDYKIALKTFNTFEDYLDIEWSSGESSKIVEDPQSSNSRR